MIMSKGSSSRFFSERLLSGYSHTLQMRLSDVQLFLMIFLRVGAIILSVPVFDSRNIPVLFKAGLVFSITLMLFPILKLEDIPIYLEILPFTIGVFREICLGFIIGLSVKFIFSGIQLAGQFTGVQMGFGMARVLDPQTGSQVSLMGQFNFILAMLIFLAINAHHWFFYGIVESFKLIPPMNFQFNYSLLENLVRYSTNMFIIAIKLGAPIMISLLLTSVALGLITRTVPQMHVMIVAMPVKIIIGLMFLAFSLPYLASFLRLTFYNMANEVVLLLRTAQ